MLSTATSISSFTVKVTRTDNSVETYDNNGNSFPVSDTVIYQKPQSCVTNGVLSVTAAVRNTVTSPTVTLNVMTKTPRIKGRPVPSLGAFPSGMNKTSTVGPYDIYTGSFALSSSLVAPTKFDVMIDTSTGDFFKDTSELTATCGTLSNTPSSSSQSSTMAASTSSVPSSASSSTPSSSTASAAGSSSSIPSSAPSSASASSTVVSSSSTSAASSPSSTLWTYKGCYTEATNGRALTGSSTTNAAMTIEMCGTYCSKFQYFGVEYGQECYCGNSFASGSVITSESDCSFKCPGNSAEKCGAGNRLNVYTNNNYTAPSTPGIINGYKYLGCYSDNVPGRVLTDSQTANDQMTVQSCIAFCNGTNYAGLEYGRECYCGNTLLAASTNQSASDCSTPCKGDSSEICGNGNRLSLYVKTTVVPGWTSLGCYTDAIDGKRVLTAASTTSGTSMTYGSCASFCSSYQYFGVEYGGECYCGNSFTNPTTQSDASACNMACSGDSTQTCGGPSRMNLFKAGTTVQGPANPTVSGWNYTGCWTDNTNGRALGSSTTASSTMTIEMCTSYCGGKGYTMAGVEYGQECWCASSWTASSTQAADSDCSFNCPGNKGEYCGAGNRLTVYSKL
jgi:hypothetical protein